MTVKTGSAWAGTFVCLDATGALAAGTPAGALYVDGTANAAEVTITGSNPYKWAVILPALTAGQRVDMYITATIDTVETAGIVASAQADTFITSDIETLVDGLETMLTDIHDTDLPAVKTETASILEDTGTTIPATLADLALEDTLTAIKGAGWNDETLVAIQAAIEAVVGGATAQQVWEYATRVLTAGTNIDLSSLATATDLATVDGIVDAIKAKTDLIPASPAEAGEYTTALTTIDDFLDTEVAAILADTNELQTDWTNGGRLDLLLDTATGTDVSLVTASVAEVASGVWSHVMRTLTNQGVTATTPATGDPLVIYRDTTVSIALTGLGNTASAAKVLFTVKENLEDADASSILQVLCTLGSPDTDTLLYVNKAAPTSADEGTFVFANHTDGTATVTVVPAAAADLPIYAAAPLYWDVKMISSDATPVVTILATGTMYIYGTPTRTIA